MTLDVFNCSPTDPPDGNLYMSGMTDIICFESETHLFLFPFGIVALGTYVIAGPLTAFFILRRNKLTSYNRLYYLFRPGKAGYWICIILLRKFLIAFTALMFRTTPSYQMAFSLLVMFGAYARQVRHLPYMSPSDYDRTVQQHLLKASIAETLNKSNDHLVIRDKMLAVERSYSKGGDRQGAWGRDAAIGAAMADLEEERAVNVSFAMFLVDYNAVESALLACAVLVNLSGIMFLSNRFNDP